MPHYFHIHVNCFLAELPPSAKALYRQLGFVPTQCNIRQRDRLDPLWILTRKLGELVETEQVFEMASKLLARDPAFRGYIESEVLDAEEVLRLSGKQTRDCELPAWSATEFADRQRASDIHIFRPLEHPRDAIDSQLEQRGFYEVATQRERIWTLLVGDAMVARSLFVDIAACLKHVAGVTKIEREDVISLNVIPPEFAMRQVATRFRS